jgi:hypothetical protein
LFDARVAALPGWPIVPADEKDSDEDKSHCDNESNQTPHISINKLRLPGLDLNISQSERRGGRSSAELYSAVSPIFNRLAALTSNALPITNRRYGRLQTCATALPGSRGGSPTLQEDNSRTKRDVNLPAMVNLAAKY